MRTLTFAGAALASLLFALPTLAAESPNPAAQQAAPSPKPAAQEKTGAVDPGKVGAAPTPGPQQTGTAQAAPSPVPAPAATPPAVEARTEHKQ